MLITHAKYYQITPPHLPKEKTMRNALFLKMLIPVLCFLLPLNVHAGKWKTGEGPTVELAMQNAIDKLKNDSKIRSVDNRTKQFKVKCTDVGPIYSVRMHGNKYSSGGYPNSEWIKMEANRLQGIAKICPLSNACNVRLNELLIKWTAGNISSDSAMHEINQYCGLTSSSS